MVEFSRKNAAEFLNISVKSFDRYIKKQGITPLRRKRELFFTHADLEKLGKLMKGNETMKHSHRWGDSQPEVVAFPEVHQAQLVEQETTLASEKKLPAEERIYKALFEEAEGEMKEIRVKLDHATYRVGSLETQIKTMVPLLEFQKQKKELLQLSDENKTQKKNLKEIEKSLQIERFAKKIYAAFLFFMVTLLPLLVILRFFSDS